MEEEECYHKTEALQTELDSLEQKKNWKYPIVNPKRGFGYSRVGRIVTMISEKNGNSNEKSQRYGNVTKSTSNKGPKSNG